MEPLENRVMPSVNTLALLNGNSGDIGSSGLIMDNAGNLYVAAESGGAAGLGAVYELKKGSGSVTTLASFTGPATGVNPVGGIIMDGAGNLYGTTSPDAPYPGIIYEIKAGSSTITKLAILPNASIGGLVIDSDGNLYGTTQQGGAYDDGTVFELAAGSGTITTLASFDGYDGAYSSSSLVLDGSGNLYGATVSGGTNNDGAVFEIAQGSGTITTLASFTGTNGVSPSGVVLDSEGNLYGTTQSGGAKNNGTVFELAQGSGTITTLASFSGANGDSPKDGVVLDTSGNLYGTTQSEGADGYGTIFEFVQGSGTITTLASFNGTDGGYPAAGVVRDSNGNLFGVTSRTYNPHPYGTIFEIPNLSTPTLVPSQQPPSVVDINTPFTCMVTADDASGNPLTSFTGPVTVSLTNNTTGATLSGTTTVDAVAGIATFSNLVISLEGTGYTLTASASALASGVSNTVDTVLPSFILLSFGNLYEQNLLTGTSTLLGSAITSVSSVGTNSSGTAMVDVTASNGYTYEYQEGAHWTVLAQGVSKAEPGNGTSVVLIGTDLYEYNDTNSSWTCLADAAASFSVGTDTSGSTLIGVILTNGNAYEYSDTTGWQFLAHNAAQSSVGQGGDLDLILSNGYLYQHSNATSSWLLLETNVSAVALGTDVDGAPLAAVQFNSTGSPAYLDEDSTGLSAPLAVGAGLSAPTAGYTLFVVNGNCYSLDPSTDWTYYSQYGNVSIAV
jgi:uncharacterized repeat protein (TIGR03803 family)